MTGSISPDFDQFRALLANASLHFRYAFGITATRPEISYLHEFTFGQHRAGHDELSLTSAEEELARSALEHCAVYLCIVQIHTVLEGLYPDPFCIPDPQVQSAFHAARLIRNAFAHNPFDPKWSFGPTWEDRTFVVPEVLSLNTEKLSGARVKREHFGGPLAIFRFLGYCERTLETVRRRAT